MLPPRLVHIQISIGDMTVQVGTSLLIEIIDGAIGHFRDFLHVLVPSVGGRIRTVAVQVVTSSVSVVCSDIQPLGEVEHESVGDHPIAYLPGVLVPAVRKHAATSGCDRRICELDAVGVHRDSAVRVYRNDGRADILGDIPENTRRGKVLGTVLFPESAVVVGRSFIA